MCALQVISTQTFSQGSKQCPKVLFPAAPLGCKISTWASLVSKKRFSLIIISELKTLPPPSGFFLGLNWSLYAENKSGAKSKLIIFKKKKKELLIPWGSWSWSTSSTWQNGFFIPWRFPVLSHPPLSLPRSDFCRFFWLFLLCKTLLLYEIPLVI